MTRLSRVQQLQDLAHAALHAQKHGVAEQALLDLAQEAQKQAASLREHYGGPTLEQRVQILGLLVRAGAQVVPVQAPATRVEANALIDHLEAELQRGIRQ